jgi:diguanylate cyclase (GGDEF)-like protein
MERFRNKYRAFIIAVLLVLGLPMSVLYSAAVSKVRAGYVLSATESILQVKRSFLKDTVNQVIADIERSRREGVETCLKQAAGLEELLDGFSQAPGESFLGACVSLLKKYDDFSVLITERQTNKILYASSTGDETPSLSADTLEELSSVFPVFSRLEYNRHIIYLYVRMERIDERVKAEIYEKIHGYRFSNDAYIWVNEVLDYSGGDHYAIRRIHPNLKDTEGMYLSTDMTDVADNLPDLTELEGVKQNGELFFSYYFKKLNSEDISEKLSYAKLYPDYDWIIAMGVHLDDIKAYVTQSTRESARNVRTITLSIAGITAFLVVLAIIFISFLERWYYKSASRALGDKVYRDSLTNAYNRRGAETLLKSAFHHFKRTAQNASVILFDIDEFKKINDACGHDAGDHVLVRTVEAVSRYIRGTDALCRWGGDEFLLLCPGLKDDDVLPFTEKLVRMVSELPFECLSGTEKHNVTISMGVSAFLQSDADSSAAVTRADKALYQSKAQGKNQAST